MQRWNYNFTGSYGSGSHVDFMAVKVVDVVAGRSHYTFCTDTHILKDVEIYNIAID